jgi:8-oxo-dGTP pyrophosphatase MutT (NUDIX family)
MATTSTGGQPVCPATKQDKPGYALVIAHYLDPTTNIRSFFIGQESVYKPDSKTKKSFRSIPSTQTTNAARIAFAQKNTDFVSGTTKVVLRLKPGTTDEYKYTIQEVPSDPFHGFPKGAGLTKDEKGIDIAKREFKEETGYVLPRDPVYKRCIEFTATDNSGNKIPTVCVVFHYEVVDDKEKNAIEKAFSYKTV